MHLLLFDSDDAIAATHIISLDPALNPTGHYWHIRVPKILPGQVYACRADGPYCPEEGFCFDPDKVLLDPYKPEPFA